MADKPIKIYYQLLVVTEGGADFQSFHSLSEVVRIPSLDDEDIIALVRAELGDVVEIDGCSSIYVLRNRG